MVFEQEVIRKMVEKFMVLKGGEICWLIRQEFQPEESDEGLGVVYHNYSVDLDTETSPGL